MPTFRALARIRAAAVGLATAAALTGCATSDSGTAPDLESGSDATSDSVPHGWDDRDASPAAPGTPSPDTTPASVLNAVKALTTADMSVPRGMSYELSAERDAHGGRVWEIHVASNKTDEFFLRISGDGSRVLSKRKDTTPDDDVSKMPYSKTTAEQAVRLAYTRWPGELRSVEIDNAPDGKIVWQVILTSPGATDDDAGTEVTLSATTGNVLEPGPPA